MYDENITWHPSFKNEAKEKMKIIEEYVAKGIAVEICFTPEFAKTVRKYYEHLYRLSDNLLEKLKNIESILKNTMN